MFTDFIYILFISLRSLYFCCPKCIIVNSCQCHSRTTKHIIVLSGFSYLRKSTCHARLVLERGFHVRYAAILENMKSGDVFFIGQTVADSVQIFRNKIYPFGAHTWVISCIHITHPILIKEIPFSLFLCILKDILLYHEKWITFSHT